MANFRQASTGRTVYGSGSYAPTKGRVSANGMQGYVNRQIRQGGVRRQGGDGLSDTRSGLAAQALQRRQQFQNGGRPTAGGRQPFNNEGRPNNAGMGQGGRQPYNNEGRRNPNAGGGAGGGAGGSSGTPSVVINANGQLELPYSAAWSQALMEQMGEYNTSLQEIQNQQAQEALDYTRNVDATKQGYVTTQRNTLNNAGGSGTLFSTAYGTAAAGDAKNYNNTINQLLSDHTASQTAFDSERTAIINAFKQQMQQQAMAYAEEMAQGAGSHGYGGKKPPRHPGQNTSAYGPKGPKKPPKPNNNGGGGKPGKGKGKK